MSVYNVLGRRRWRSANYYLRRIVWCIVVVGTSDTYEAFPVLWLRPLGNGRVKLSGGYAHDSLTATRPTTNGCRARSCMLVCVVVNGTKVVLKCYIVCLGIYVSDCLRQHADR